MKKYNDGIYITPVADWIDTPMNLRKLQKRRRIMLRLLVLSLTFVSGIFIGASL